MADESGAAYKVSDTCNYTKQVPEHLQEFVQSRVIHYLSQAKGFSTAIERTGGQNSTKLVVNLDGRTTG